MCECGTHITFSRTHTVQSSVNKSAVSFAKPHGSVSGGVLGWVGWGGWGGSGKVCGFAGIPLPGTPRYTGSLMLHFLSNRIISQVVIPRS